MTENIKKYLEEIIFEVKGSQKYKKEIKSELSDHIAEMCIRDRDGTKDRYDNGYYAPCLQAGLDIHSTEVGYHVEITVV